MENFFNYITKPLNPDDVDIWFRSNNIINEKLILYYEITISLYQIIIDTYLGDDENNSETKIILTEDDKKNHFNWCWNKLINDFKREELVIKNDGEHYEYLFSFFDDIFYNQDDQKIKRSIPIFFNDVFDQNKPFTKSDLDLVYTIYKALDKNIEY